MQDQAIATLRQTRRKARTLCKFPTTPPSAAYNGKLQTKSISAQTSRLNCEIYSFGTSNHKLE